MKKTFFALFLCLCLVFGLCGCPSNDVEEDKAYNVNTFTQRCTELLGAFGLESSAFTTQDKNLRADFSVTLDRLQISGEEAVPPMAFAVGVLMDRLSGLEKGDVSISLAGETLKAKVFGNLVCFPDVDDSVWLDVSESGDLGGNTPDFDPFDEELWPDVAEDSDTDFGDDFDMDFGGDFGSGLGGALEMPDLSGLPDVAQLEQAFRDFLRDLGDGVTATDATFDACGQTVKNGKKLALTVTAAKVYEAFGQWLGDDVPESSEALALDLYMSKGTSPEAVCVRMYEADTSAPDDETPADAIIFSAFAADGAARMEFVVPEAFTLTASQNASGAGEVVLTPAETDEFAALRATYQLTKLSNGVSLDVTLSLDFAADGMTASMEVPFSFSCETTATQVHFTFSTDASLLGMLSVAGSVEGTITYTDDTASADDLAVLPLLSAADQEAYAAKLLLTYPNLFALLESLA